MENNGFILNDYTLINEILNRPNEFDENELKNQLIFKDWITEQGVIYDLMDYPVSFGKLKVVGARAKQIIEGCTPLLYVPKKLIIDSAEVKDNLSSLFKKNKRLKQLHFDKGNLALILYLCFEYLKGDKSYHYPFFKIMFGTLPAFWDQETLNQFDDNNFIVSLLEMKKDFEFYYEELSQIFKKAQIVKEFIPKNKYFEIVTFILSRNFQISNERSFLVPFADSFNHGTSFVINEIFDSKNHVSKYSYEFNCYTVELLKHTKHYFPITNLTNKGNNEDATNETNDDKHLKLNEDDYFSIVTSEFQTFDKGTEVLNNYGLYSNRHLLKCYGFCMLNNKYNNFKIMLTLYKDPEDDSFCSFLRRELKVRIKEDEETMQLIFKLKQEKLSIKLIRYFVLEYVFENDLEKEFSKNVFNIDFELIALDKAIEIIRNTLEVKNQNYPYDLDYLKLKEEILNKEEADYFKTMILIFRLTQKDALITYLNSYLAIKEILEIFKQNKIIELDQIINDKCSSFEGFNQVKNFIIEYFEKTNIIK